MGAIGGLLGTAGGISGTGFSTTPGTNAEQINTAYNNAQTGLNQQNDLLTALKGQNGLGNQAQVYNQLQGVVSGQGPNPAQAMLNQQTGANVANQAALMAGQRGAGANVGLMARQNAQRGANIQQQAAGQGATMQANQSLNALGQVGGIANTQVANQIGQTNALSQAQQAEQGVLQGANTANNAIQGQLANTSLQNQANLASGFMSGFGATSSMGGMAAAGAHGGKVVSMAEGGDVGGFSPQSMFGQFLASPEPAIPTFSNPGVVNWGNKSAKQVTPLDPTAGAENITPQGWAGADPMKPSSEIGVDPTMSSTQMVAAGGGKVPAMLSPGERFLKPNEAKAVADGEADPMKVGETIPGKASVKGDSLKNDTVPKKLEVGGIVLPRSITQSKNPGAEAKRFVDAYMSKKKVKKA